MDAKINGTEQNKIVISFNKIKKIKFNLKSTKWGCDRRKCKINYLFLSCYKFNQIFLNVINIVQ